MTDVFHEEQGTCEICDHFYGHCKQAYCNSCFADHYMHVLKEDHPACEHFIKEE